MNNIRTNIVANIAGNGWMAVVSIVFIPLYIHFVGIEAYGLIGFFTTLLAVLSLLDLGLSSALNREMARLSIEEDRSKEMGEVLSTLEIIYWGMAVVIGAAVVLTSPWIADHWLKSRTLPVDTLRQCIQIMGLILSFRWPYALYVGGLNGLQKQTQYNFFKVVLETSRAVGAVLVLKFISPTIQAYFIWQIVVSLAGTLGVALLLRSQLPRGVVRLGFSVFQLKKIWRFAAGLSGITFLVTILMQLDKIILSKMLSLEDFGYYSLAATAALGLAQLTAPLFAAFYPRFSQLVALGEEQKLKLLYHRGCQLMTVIIVPVALVIAFFPKEVLFLWTRDFKMADHAYRLLAILIMGSAINGLLNIPYALQLAYGWTSLSFYLNLGSLIILTPTIILVVNKFGAVGGAFSSIMLNTGNMIFGMYFMHRKLLIGQRSIWYLRDILRPTLFATLVMLMGRFLIKTSFSPVFMAGSLGVVLMSSMGIALWFAPELKLSFIQTWDQFKIRKKSE